MTYFFETFFLLFTVVKICTFYTRGVKFQIHTGCSFVNGKSLRNQLRNIISFCKDPSVANAGMIFETGVNSKHTLILIPAYFRVILSIFFVRDSWNFKSHFSKVITIKSTQDRFSRERYKHAVQNIGAYRYKTFAHMPQFYTKHTSA